MKAPKHYNYFHSQKLFLMLFLLSIMNSNYTKAQFTDNFTDGNFSAAPTWTGDAAEFTVNGTQQLQLNNTIAGASYLSAANNLASINNLEWRFYIKQTFSPSSSNYGRVYLVSDQSNLEGSLNGYYLQFGEAGTADAVELFRQTGLTSTSVCRATNGQIANSFSIGIKVTRDALGNWNLSIDLTGGTLFTLEATGTDATYTSTQFIGVSTLYTISNANKFFYDDFYCGAPIVDITAPTISSVNILSANQLEIFFNESVDLTTSQVTANYNVINAIGNATVATRDLSNFSLVQTTYGTSFSSGITYTVVVNGVQDLAGNAISNGTATFTYYNFATPSFGDVIINEIMADPNTAVGLPAVEFIEVHNANSSAWFNMNGWKFTDNTTTSTIAYNYYLAPGDYALLCKTSDTTLFTSGIKKIGMSTFPTLNDGGDNIFLKDNLNSTIDSVIYSNSWYNNTSKANGGWTLERINPNNISPCPIVGNWSASNDVLGGTPGNQNSIYSIVMDVTGPTPISTLIIDSTHITICFNEALNATTASLNTNYTINNGIGNPLTATLSADLKCVDLILSTPLINLTTYTVSFSSIGDCSGNTPTPAQVSFTFIKVYSPAVNEIVINEIMADYNPSVGLPSAEYLEIYNTTSKYLQCQGLTITDNTSTATLDYYVLPPNGYLLLCDKADTALFSSITNKLGLTSFPSLNDAGDDLTLKDAGNNVLDNVFYLNSWHINTTKDDGGWSLELINPIANVNCVSQSNWTSSNNVLGGTPGVQNSVYSTVADVTSPTITSVSTIDSTRITVCYSEILNTTAIATASNYIINGSPASISSMTIQTTGYCVDITLSTALQNMTTYTLSIQNISDCSGNPLNPSQAIFTYYEANTFDVLIHEFMADPDPAIGLPSYEYLELYNKTNNPINLANWKFIVGSSTKILPNITIQADSFIVLTSVNGLAEYQLQGFNLPMYSLSSFPSLLNTGTSITLRNSNGKLIHHINYNDSWYNDAAKAEGGWSIEMIDANNPCAGVENWKASTFYLGGTPGKSNSVSAANPDLSTPQLKRVSVVSSDTISLFFNESLDSLFLNTLTYYSVDQGIGNPTAIIGNGPGFKSVTLKLSSPIIQGIVYTCTVNSLRDCSGNIISSNNSARFALPDSAEANDLVVNEIMFDPNTGGVEWVEIINRSNKIIDVGSLNIGDYDTIINIPTDTKLISAEGYLIFPGEYLVLSTNGNVIKAQYNALNPNWFLDLVSMPSLSLDDEISISTTTGKLIDFVKYKEKMHFPLLNVTKGVSLERIDFNRPSNDATNWNSASAQVGFATPSYKNSQYLQTETSTSVSVNPEIFSPDNDGYQDVLNISYKLDGAGQSGNVSIYDSKGRFVKYLVKNEILGVEGTISWNGVTEQNEKAPIGIYIIYFEISDLASGKIKGHKLSCVLAGKMN